jgi:hypothetical protein
VLAEEAARISELASRAKAVFSEDLQRLKEISEKIQLVLGGPQSSAVSPFVSPPPPFSFHRCCSCPPSTPAENK